MKKAYGRLLKENIEKAEPGVKLPNKLMSTIYKIPELGEEILNSLPLGRPITKGIRFGGSMIQRTVPSSGGLFKYLFPAAIKGIYETERENQR